MHPRQAQLLLWWTQQAVLRLPQHPPDVREQLVPHVRGHVQDRKSTRLNSSHVEISYAVFCLKKKKKNRDDLYDGHRKLPRHQKAQILALLAVQVPAQVHEPAREVGVVLGALGFFFNDTATTEIYTLSLHDALPI